LDSTLNSFFSKATWAFDSLAIIIWTPGSAVDIHFIKGVPQCRAFYTIIYRSVQKTHACLPEKWD
jgi:hypothetical protein